MGAVQTDRVEPAHRAATDAGSTAAPDHSPEGGPLSDCRPGRALVRLGHQPGSPRAVLCRAGAKHGGQLAQLLLRLLRSRRDGHRGQAPRRLLGSGPVRSDLRVPHLGDRPAPGHRRRSDRPRPLSGREPAAGERGGPHRCLHPRGQSRHRRPQPGQHLRHRHDAVLGAGGRRRLGRHRVGATAPSHRCRGVDRDRLPGEDARSLAGATGVRAGLPVRPDGGVGRQTPTRSWSAGWSPPWCPCPG